MVIRALSASSLHEASGGGERLAGRRLLAAVALASMLAPLNSTMVAVALPHIAADFGNDMGQAGWLVTGYLVAMAALQPVAGKLGDRLGRRPLLLGGVAWFGLASLAAVTAQSLPALIFARMQQGVAGAVALPNATAVLREVVPADRRAGRFGAVGAAIGLAAAAGPLLGGVLVATAGWQAVFAVNLIFVVPALLLGWRSIPARPGRRAEEAFDLTGAVLLSATLAGIALLIVQRDHGRPRLVVIVLGLAAAFLWHEFRHPNPVLQPRHFRRPALAAANAAVALSNLAMYAVLLATPMLLAARNGWGSARVGLVLAALSGGMIVCAPIGGRLADVYGRRRPTIAGLSLVATGLLPLALTGGRITTAGLVLGLALAGVGLGLASPALQTAAVESVAPAEAGVASGLFSTSRYLGGIVGSSVLSRLLDPTSDGMEGFAAVFRMALAAGLLSALASFGLRERAR
jgi:EmrB/QacA subfamily drug resistance transporter